MDLIAYVYIYIYLCMHIDTYIYLAWPGPMQGICIYMCAQRYVYVHVCIRSVFRSTFIFFSILGTTSMTVQRYKVTSGSYLTMWSTLCDNLDELSVRIG